MNAANPLRGREKKHKPEKWADEKEKKLEKRGRKTTVQRFPEEIPETLSHTRYGLQPSSTHIQVAGLLRISCLWIIMNKHYITKEIDLMEIRKTVFCKSLNAR